MWFSQGTFNAACFAWISSVMEKRAKQVRFGGNNTYNLSMSYDYFLRDLSTKKLEAYGLDKPSLNLVNDT